MKGRPQKLSKERIETMISLRWSDPKQWTHKRLAKRFNVHENTVRYYLNPKSRAKQMECVKTYVLRNRSVIQLHSYVGKRTKNHLHQTKNERTRP